jgi:5-methylcytosine-specific restriction endonuclease McrA
MRVLKIDASFHPIEVIPWEKAFYLLFKDKAEVVEWYDDKFVRSTKEEHQIPSVIKVNMVLDKNKNAKFCRENVYTRDDYTCQYCGAFGSIELTFDHVTPRSKGGATAWENIVTACSPCNRKKANKTLREAKMDLINVPCIPRWSPRAVLKLKETDPKSWQNYIKY